jgi:flavin-dependent dehydrogenase
MVKSDILIVGGGPAGLAAAIAVRQKGFAVTVMESSKPPIDKACGEGLMPDGVEALKKLGVRLGPLQSAPFRGIRFVDSGTTALAEFPGAYGLGVRRTTLHSLLAERAADAGVRLLWNTCVRDLDTTSAGWIVGADGRNSRVREWAGFGKCSVRVRRFGFRRHFPVAPWSDSVEVHWGSGCQIYVTPVSVNEVCVAVVSRHQDLRLHEALRGFPEVARHLSGLVPDTQERGSVTECRRLRRVVRGNVILAGDASGSVDAVTGEGLALSFQQSLALADALESGDLTSYESAHRRIARMPALMGKLMLLMDRRPWVRHRVIRALASESSLFSKLLAMHVGAMPAHEFGFGGLFTLGWELLTANGRPGSEISVNCPQIFRG